MNEDESFFIEDDMGSDYAELSILSSLNLNSSTFTLAASTLSGGTTARSHRDGGATSFKSYKSGNRSIDGMAPISAPRPTECAPAAVEQPAVIVPPQPTKEAVLLLSTAATSKEGVGAPEQANTPMPECAPTPLLSLRSPPQDESPPTDDTALPSSAELKETNRPPSLRALHFHGPPAEASPTPSTAAGGPPNAERGEGPTAAPVRRRSIDDVYPPSAGATDRVGGNPQQAFLDAVVRFDQPQARSPTNGASQVQPSPLLMSSRKRSVVLYDPQDEVLGPLSIGGGVFASFDMPVHDSVEGTPTNSNTNPPSRDPPNEAGDAVSPTAATTPPHQRFLSRGDRPTLVLRVPSFTSVHRSVDCDSSSPSYQDSTSQHPQAPSSLFRLMEATQPMLSPASGGTETTPKRTSSAIFVDSLTGEPVNATTLSALGVVPKRVGSFSQASSRNSPQFLQLHHEVSPKQSYQYFITSGNDDALSSCSHTGGSVFEGSRRGIVLLTARSDAVQNVAHRHTPQAAGAANQPEQHAAQPSRGAQPPHATSASSSASVDGGDVDVPNRSELLIAEAGGGRPFVVSSDRRTVAFTHVKPSDTAVEENEIPCDAVRDPDDVSSIAQVAAAPPPSNGWPLGSRIIEKEADMRRAMEVDALCNTMSLVAVQEAAARWCIASHGYVLRSRMVGEWYVAEALQSMQRAFAEASSDVLLASHHRVAASQLLMAQCGLLGACEAATRWVVQSDEAVQLQRIAVQWGVARLGLYGAAGAHAIVGVGDALGASYRIVQAEAHDRRAMERTIRSERIVVASAHQSVVATQLQGFLVREVAQRRIAEGGALLMLEGLSQACRTRIHELAVRDCIVATMDAYLVMLYVAFEERCTRQHLVTSYVVAIETTHRYQLRVLEAKQIQTAVLMLAEDRMRAQHVTKRRVELRSFASNLYCAEVVYPVEQRRRRDVERDVLQHTLPSMHRSFVKQYDLLVAEYHNRRRIEGLDWGSTRLVLLEAHARAQLSLHWGWCMSAMDAAYRGVIHYLAHVVPAWMQLATARTATGLRFATPSSSQNGGNPRVAAMLFEWGTCFTDTWQYEQQASQAVRRQRLLRLFLVHQEDSLTFRQRGCKARCAAGTRQAELRLYQRKQRIREDACRRIASPIRHRSIDTVATSNPLLCFGAEEALDGVGGCSVALSTSSTHNLAVGRIRKYQAARSRLKGHWPEDRYNEGRWHSVCRMPPRMELCAVATTGCVVEAGCGGVKRLLQRTRLWRRLSTQGGVTFAVGKQGVTSTACKTLFLRGTVCGVRLWLFAQRHASKSARLQARRASGSCLATTPVPPGDSAPSRTRCEPVVEPCRSATGPPVSTHLRAAATVSAARKPILCVQAFARACCSRLELRSRLRQLPSRYALALRSLVSHYEYLDGYGQQLQSAVEGVLGTRRGDYEEVKPMMHRAMPAHTANTQRHRSGPNPAAASTVDTIHAASIYQRYDAHLVPGRRRPFSAGTVRPSRGSLDQHNAEGRTALRANATHRPTPSTPSQCSTTLMMESVSDALAHWADRCATSKRQATRRALQKVVPQR